MPYEWIPYALSAVASAAGSAFQNSGSASSQKRAFGYQQRLMYEQAQLNQQMANNMFQAENEYNHPVAMMSRELKAGMNPYAIAQQLGAGRSVPADGAAASVSPASSPVGAPYQAPFINMSADIANVGNAIKSIADAKKANIDTTAAEENLQTYLEQQKEQLKSTKLSNTHQEIENSIFKEFGRSRAAYEVDKIACEVMLTLAKEDESKWNQSLIKQKIYESQAYQGLLDSQKEQINKMLPWLEKEMVAKINNLIKQGNMFDAQGHAALATAQNQLQQATNARELLDGMKRIQSSQEFGNNINGLAALLDCYMKFKSFPMLQQSLRNKVDQELKNLDWTDTDKVVENMSKLMNAFSNALGTVGSFIPKTP